MRIPTLMSVFIFIGACSRLYEPYPALTYTPVRIAETPPAVLKSFRDGHPHAAIEAVLLHDFHSKHSGYHDYHLRFLRSDGRADTLAFDSDGDTIKRRPLPPDYPQWQKSGRP
jgi:hypothetical protein